MKCRKPWIALALLVSLTSCGGAPTSGAEAAPQAAEPKRQTPEKAQVAEQPDVPAPRRAPERDGEPTVKLLEAGKEPRAPLRYTPAPSQREAMLMEMKMALGVGTPDAPGATMPLPGTTMRMNLVVESVASSGDVSYRFDLAGVDVSGGAHPPKMVEQIRSATSKLVGMGGQGTLTSRGLVKEMQMKVPPGVDPATRELITEMERSMRQMCDPLPQEAIGAGARWDVHTRYSLRGLEIDQVRRYTLLSREGNKAKMKFIVEQTAKPQAMKLPNLPPKAVVKLEQLASAGDGEVTLDTQRIVPRSSKMALKTTSVIRLVMEGEKTMNRTDMEIEVSISPDTGAKP
jgi:hypothetical protein